jgi:hypothetical protein
MAIVGEHPSEGTRVVLERPVASGDADGPPWRYEGTVYTPVEAHAVRVDVSAEGVVDVHFTGTGAGTQALATPGPDAELAERVRLIVRTAYKQATADGMPPARRLVRWRADRA